MMVETSVLVCMEMCYKYHCFQNRWGPMPAERLQLSCDSGKVCTGLHGGVIYIYQYLYLLGPSGALLADKLLR